MYSDRIIFISFTKNGIELAQEIAKNFDSEIHTPKNLHEFMSEYFYQVKAIIFVSACGIAVRAIAPFLKSKLTDPAVIVIDEKAKFVIPILSGHIGGANELARKIAGIINAQAVITTATDLNNIIAVDEWAVKNNCVIENPEMIKKISGTLLNNQTIGVAVTEKLQETPFEATLFLRPKNLILGAGCKKNISPEEFESTVMKFLEGAGVSELSLCALATIDLKSNERAFLNFAGKHGILFLTFTAKELMSVEREYFSKSEKVFEITGADNICERAAIFCGEKLTNKNKKNVALLRSKFIFKGITLALARI